VISFPKIFDLNWRKRQVTVHLGFTIGEFWWTAHPWMAVVDQCRGYLGAMITTRLSRVAL
jgi:hypothetical protein